MDYQDFVLQLDRAAGEPGFLTRVIRSPAGEAEAPFVNPILPDELDSLWRTAHATRKASRNRGARDLKPELALRDPLAAELSLESVGERLFRALFRGPVHSCWTRSLAESEQSSERGLRLKLQLNVADPLLAPLAELPWECLFSLEQGGFLGLQRQTPILRHVRLPLPVGQTPAAQPLRILIVSSQPGTMAELSLAEESQKIAAALSSLPGIETLALKNPSVEHLRDVLLERDFHVLHFMGHGGFDPESGQGVLYFTDDDGAPVQVSGTLLASHLAGLHALRLVFLNACETARTSARAPFAGVATALLRSGLTAVIAMQRPIQDAAALEFSRAVYRRLAVGDPIDAAVTEGRLAIARGRGAMLEWGTPVLFLRAEDGRLFSPTSPLPQVKAVEPPMEPGPIPRGQPRLVRGLSLIAGVLLVGLVLGWLQWSRDPGRQREPQKENNVVRGPASPEVSTVLTTDVSPPQPVKEIEPKPAKKPQPSSRGSGGETQAAETTTASPPPRASSSYTIGPESPVSVPALKAEIGAVFFEREGYPLVRFSITPSDEGMLQHAPVMGPGSLDFPAQNGTYRLDVLSLDAVQKRATVRLRFLSKP
jgi:hypothetical protein